MNLPAISNYGQYASDNYGKHTLLVEMPDVMIWFSYETPVAFSTGDSGLIVHKNIWGTTTGKHLNWIDDGDKEAKARRVNAAQFQELWDVWVGMEAARE